MGYLVSLDLPSYLAELISFGVDTFSAPLETGVQREGKVSVVQSFPSLVQHSLAWQRTHPSLFPSPVPKVGSSLASLMWLPPWASGPPKLLALCCCSIHMPWSLQPAATISCPYISGVFSQRYPSQSLLPAVPKPCSLILARLAISPTLSLSQEPALKPEGCCQE